VLFEFPTVVSLAAKLDDARPKETELSRILDILVNMENISEEEVTTLLAQSESQSQV